MVDKSVDKSVFRFKHFELANEKSAMKIGTDGVLLGAWAHVLSARTAWDVGCGTGLIALMLAQRTDNMNIIGIEIDSDAAEESLANVRASEWNRRVRVVHDDVLKCYKGLPVPDLIVSNPPFFKNALKAHGLARNSARHDDTLSYADLIRVASESLSSDGCLCMVSPVDRREDIEWACCLYKLNIQHIVEVVTAPGKVAKRLLWRVGREERLPVHDVLYIRDSMGEYTEEYRALTADFYLDF